MENSCNKIYWYVIFARTGSEERLAEKLKEQLNGDRHKPFVLTGGQIRRRQGIKTEYHKPCFPGYIFVESSDPPTVFIKSINPLIRKIEGLYRLLNSNDDRNVAIREEERLSLNAIFGDEHCIDVPTVLKEGDTVKVISGILSGHESKIVKVNRNGVVIHFEMFGKPVEVSLGVDLVRVV
ncbi:MAG: hypothetical protein LBD23_16980 [Oscillospiraceae bacterium]|jgi:transcriptional antiterminator NusG|nr:hypothetical protein [Oscillospiraceae bacterium]